MAYVMLYVENADVLATFETLAEAQDALNSFVRQHPEVRDDAAILELDETGHGVGPYVYAEQRSALFA